MRVSIKQVGKPIKQFILEEDAKIKRFRSSLFTLGKKTHNFMLDFIATNTTTFKDVPQPDAQPLIETIDYEEISLVDGYGWAIGDIDKLNEVSKHWYYINYGQGFDGNKKHPQAGKMVPGKFNSANVFAYAPYSGNHIIVGVDTVIQPMNYIQATVGFLELEIIKLLLRYDRG